MLENYNSHINVDVTSFFFTEVQHKFYCWLRSFRQTGKIAYSLGNAVELTKYPHPLKQPLRPAAGIAAGSWFGK